MLYLYVIDTHNDELPKSMLIEESEAYRIGKLISKNEKDNLIFISEIKIDKNHKHRRTMTILHIFLNGNDDMEYMEKHKINKKNN